MLKNVHHFVLQDRREGIGQIVESIGRYIVSSMMEKLSGRCLPNLNRHLHSPVNLIHGNLSRKTCCHGISNPSLSRSKVQNSSQFTTTEEVQNPAKGNKGHLSVFWDN